MSSMISPDKSPTLTPDDGSGSSTGAGAGSLTAGSSTGGAGSSTGSTLSVPPSPPPSPLLLQLNAVQEEMLVVIATMQAENAPHLWNDYDPNQFHPTFDIDILNDELCAATCQDFYKKQGAAKQRRFGPQCPNIDVIINCKYLFGLQHPGVIPLQQPNPYLAMYTFDRRNQCEVNGVPIPMQEARRLILRYFHHVAAICVPMKILRNNNFFPSRCGLRRLRTWKRAMAAYIVLSFVREGEDGFDTSVSLNCFQTLSPALYWCFILPVVHTMVVMMDNERPTNLSVTNILDYNVGNFVKRMAVKITECGVWSQERLKLEKDKHGHHLTPAIGKPMALGVHHTVARIFIMLSSSDAPLRDLRDVLLWLTVTQKTGLLTGFDPVHVKFRVIQDIA